MKTIKAILSPNKDSQTVTFTLDDLGTNQEEWDKMSDSEKEELIRTIGVYELPEQPFWELDSFKEEG